MSGGVGDFRLVVPDRHNRATPAPVAPAGHDKKEPARRLRPPPPPVDLGGPPTRRGGAHRGAPALWALLTLAFLVSSSRVAGSALDVIGAPVPPAGVARIADAGLLALAAGVGLIVARLTAAILGVIAGAARGRLGLQSGHLFRWRGAKAALLVGLLAAWAAATGGAALLRVRLDAAPATARAAAAADAVRIVAITTRQPAADLPTAELPAGDGADAALPDPAFRPTLLTTPTGRTVLALRWATTGRLSGEASSGAGAPGPAPWKAALATLAVARIGTAAEVYDHVFIPSVRAVRDAYNRYVAAQVRLLDALRAVPQRQDEAWARVAAVLPGQDGDALAGLDGAALAAALTRSGLDPPPDWRPGNRAAFLAMAAAVLRADAARAYDAAVSRLLGVAVPPGLSWDAFVTLPAVQGVWAGSLGTAAGGLRPDMGPERFRALVYEPRVRAAMTVAAAVLDGSAAPTAGEGRAALAWAAVPSVVFLAVTPLLALHLVLLLADLSALITAARWHRAALVVGVSACLVVGWLGTPPPVGALAGAYSAAEDAVAQKAAPLWLAARLAARTAPLLALGGGGAWARDAAWPGALLRHAGVPAALPVERAGVGLTGFPAIDGWLGPPRARG